MCGIVAIHDRSRRPVDPELFERQCRSIVHRGPDDEGTYFDDGVAIGMRRLSIVDLEGGHQPICNEDETVWIVFNGEIYNQAPLRQRLQALGHEFRTHTDTEVIVHLYEEYGERCVEHLNGMFGFAIWDSRHREMLIARDRLGIKPLFYTEQDGRIQVASEIKPLLQDPSVPRRVNRSGLHHYLHYLYVPTPETMFEGIYKLPPGHLMILNDSGVTVQQWWDVEFAGEEEMSEDQAVEGLQQHLYQSVERRLMAEVPLGAYLSGGIDSSVIVALMSQMRDQPVKTFTLGFGDANAEYNELGYAREVAEEFKTDHHEFTVTERHIAESLDDIVWYFDEPFGGGLHTYFVSQMAKDHVTVALTGLGSDELFAGYDRQRRMKMTNWYTKLPQYLRDEHIEQVLTGLPPAVRNTRTYQRIERLIGRSHLSEAQNYSNEIDMIRPATRQRILSDAMLEESVDPVAFLERVIGQKPIDSVWDRQSYMELKTTMVDDFLNYVDRMGMAHSMELRVPFLDHELVEFATRVPFQYKLKGFTTKYVLRQVAQRLIPERIVNRKKQPFFLPLGNWIRNDLRPAVEGTLIPEKIAEQGFFSAAGVRQLLDEHFQGQADHAWPLWSLYVFQAWHDRFIESVDVPTHDTVRTQL